MSSATHVFLAFALASGPLAIALAVSAGTDHGAAARRAARALAIGALAALVLFAMGPSRPDDRLGPFATDGFSALVLILVLGVGATTLSFASRSLRHEPYQRRFAIAGAAVATAGATFAAAGDLVVLAAAWVAGSLLSVALVQTGPEAGRRQRSARIRRTFVLADVVVLAGVALLAVDAGSTSLGDLEVGGAVAALAGCLLVLGAAGRAATAPFHRWLPDTLGAPTPSSALLHGGVVNGGAILLIKVAPTIAPHAAPAVLAVVLGALSCAFAEAVMLTRPDVKGRLAWSTIAQMSFTLVLCGLGLTTAAALHLVAHGMYKASLFLGSGSTVRGLVRDRAVASAHRPAPAVLALGSAAVLGAAVAALAAAGAEVTAEVLVPVGLAVITGAAALGGWLGRAHGAGQQAQGVLGAAALVATFTLVAVALKGQVAPGIADADPVLSSALVLAVLVPLAAIARSRRHADAPNGAGLLDRTWAAVHRAGRPTAAPLAPAIRRAPRLASPTPSPAAADAALLGG